MYYCCQEGCGANDDWCKVKRLEEQHRVEVDDRIARGYCSNGNGVVMLKLKWYGTVVIKKDVGIRKA